MGLPLTMLAGWGLAAWLLPELDLWLALLVAVALAPTDATLRVPVVNNPVVPQRVRRLITVDSGLNDRIAAPVFTVAFAGAATAEGSTDTPGPAEALVGLAIGVVVGVAAGFGGGRLLAWTRRRGWAAEDLVGIAVLGLAVLAYAGCAGAVRERLRSGVLGGFGGASRRLTPSELACLEQVSGLVSLLVWLAFGAIAVPLVPEVAIPTRLLYAVLCLTVVRRRHGGPTAVADKRSRGRITLTEGPSRAAGLAYDQRRLLNER